VQYLESKLSFSTKNCILADNGRNKFDLVKYWHLKEWVGNGPTKLFHAGFFFFFSGSQRPQNWSCKSSFNWV